MLRILICDDNRQILLQLEQYIFAFFGPQADKKIEVAAYTSGDALLEKEAYADIAFLDVEMPGKSGIRVGAELKKRNPRVKIFIVTAFPDYLDEAMRCQVFRYLSKPIDKERLFRNLKDAMYQYALDTQKVTIPLKDGVLVRNADEIVCVEARQRKTYLLTTLEEVQTMDSLDVWRTRLTAPCFFSPYRSFLINMKFVSEIHRDAVVLKYGGNRKQAYLARRRYARFKDAYMLFLESTK